MSVATVGHSITKGKLGLDHIFDTSGLNNDRSFSLERVLTFLYELI